MQTKLSVVSYTKNPKNLKTHTCWGVGDKFVKLKEVFCALPDSQTPPPVPFLAQLFNINLLKSRFRIW